MLETRQVPILNQGSAFFNLRLSLARIGEAVRLWHGNFLDFFLPMTGLGIRMTFSLPWRGICRFWPEFVNHGKTGWGLARKNVSKSWQGTLGRGNFLTFFLPNHFLAVTYSHFLFAVDLPRPKYLPGAYPYPELMLSN